MFGDDHLSNILPQTLYEIQTDPYLFLAAILLDRKKILRPVNVERPEMQAMPLRIFYKRRGRVKPERVIIEHRCHKSRAVMNHEVGRCVSKQSKTERVRLGKSVIRKS